MDLGSTTAVYYLPPATGFRPALRRELETLAALGIRAHCFDPVAADGGLRERPRGLAAAAGEAAYWERYVQAFLATLRQAGDVASSSVLVGFNFGGSLAARIAALHGARGLVAAGSIPRLSQFWLHSLHPVAREARASTGTPDPTFAATMTPLDLTASLRTLQMPVFLQFGRTDDWIDPPQVSELTSVMTAVRQLRWYDDGHDMLAAGCIADRVSFVRKLLGF